MGSCISSISEEEQQYVMEKLFEALKKELLICIRAELTHSRSNPASVIQEMNIIDTIAEDIQPPHETPKLSRH
jgi:hypothetical protein